MIRLLPLMFALPVYADTYWVHTDGLFETTLTDKRVEWCKGLQAMYAVSVGNYVNEGCWQERNSLVHIQYKDGRQYAINAHEFVKVNTDKAPVIDFTEQGMAKQMLEEIEADLKSMEKP
jgi:hypothetical protein